VRLVLAGVLKGTVCQRLVPTADGESRVPATEVLVVNGRVQSWIMDANVREDVQEIIATGDYYGMHTFDQSILEMYAKGTIDLRAALAASSNPHDLSVAMRLRGLEVGRGPAEMRGSQDHAAAALQTLVEQLADESEPAKSPVAVAEPEDDDIQAPKPAPKPRRARRNKP
jgi:hypothetical protein